MIRMAVFFVLFALVSTNSNVVASNIFEEFKVSTASAEMYDHSESSLRFESKSPNYQVKLEPNIEGNVIFSIGRYGFRSTVSVRNLQFGLKIEGYVKGEPVLPSFTMDETLYDIVVDSGILIFHSISEPIPVSFNVSVDSIKLQFTNSHQLNVYQVLTIDDLQIVEEKSIDKNPSLQACDKYSIMFGIEGSKSVEKDERKTIAKQLISYFKHSPSELDSNEVCIMEFGRKVNSITASSTIKGIVKDIKGYKKAKKSGKSKSAYTNWQVAFDQAIERKPDVFIFITERWSNYSNEGPQSINGQYQTLVSKCNTLKSNGTRLLFITSGLTFNGGSNATLYDMLNAHDTKEVIGASQVHGVSLRNVDLVSMEGFDAFESLDFASLLECQISAVDEQTAFVPDNHERLQVD